VAILEVNCLSQVGFRSNLSVLPFHCTHSSGYSEKYLKENVQLFMEIKKEKDVIVVN
jgi:hypothetical protein